MIWSHHPRVASFLHWWRGAALSIGDQGIQSLANFLFAIISARFLGLEAFGTFSVIYSLTTLTQTVSTSLFLEPLPIVGARFQRSLGDRYVAAVFGAQTLLTSMASVATALLAALMAVAGSTHAPAAMAAAAVVWLMPVAALMRRVSYLRSCPAAAVAGSAVYAVWLLVATLSLQISGRLSVTSSLLALATASLAAACTCTLVLKVRLFMPDRRMFLVATVRHWRYGKWLLGAAGAFWVSSTALLPLLAAALGAQAAGAYRSITLLLSPMAQARAALSMLLLPVIARRYRTAGSAYLATATMKCMLLFVLSAAVYAGALLLFADDVILALFGAPEYVSHGYLVPWLAAVALLESFRHTLTIPVLVAEQPRRLMWARITGAAVLVVAAWPLMTAFGIVGAAINAAVVQVTVTICLLHGVRNIIFNESPIPGKTR